MPLFRRKRDADEPVDDTDRVPDEDGSPAGDGDEAPGAPAERGRPQGPWDVADVRADDVARLDLGAIQVPVPDGTEVRVDVQEDVVVAATIVDGDSALQIHAFAAPRSEGIWDEVRQEIAESIREGGGSAEEADGPFGRELRGRVPAEMPGQGVVLQTVRFLGVDGPRWFLRGLLSGPAAEGAATGQRLLDAFGGTVVVRGGEAMAPREMLPLRLPREAVEAAGHAAEPARPTLDVLERGPEITETR